MKEAAAEQVAAQNSFSDQQEVQKQIDVESVGAGQGTFCDEYEPKGLPLTRIGPSAEDRNRTFIQSNANRQELSAGDAKALDTAMQMRAIGRAPPMRGQLDQRVSSASASSSHMPVDLAAGARGRAAPFTYGDEQDGFHTPRSFFGDENTRHAEGGGPVGLQLATMLFGDQVEQEWTQGDESGTIWQ
eukprot:gnl/TRDRNA2_/TRDRNA2_165118_c4_seq1.p1 gnl/TRDRNA2_/TRDRNA2_165118_c4~~gnl/TRDRNA2_/TRDRNA2_165118_c4_seq1.p1  ORF type:complete len:187 (+),score=26.10 gnl/TRDRNA2_/TRDRNA2_165118_c4_seq1:50-610(+)